MDQVKMGRFIAEMRRQQHLTQRELAEFLSISDKSVSKWECGNGMPDIALMLPICDILKINLNELFSGEELTDANYKQRAEENMMKLIKEATSIKKNIVGGEVLGQSKNVEIDTGIAHQTNTEFWDTIGSDFLGSTALSSWGGFLPSEDKLNLLGDLAGKSILEIGCGNGHSLEYTANRGVTELWGLDISANQITKTQEYLKSKNIIANLICSPNCIGYPNFCYHLAITVCYHCSSIRVSVLIILNFT